eukprot:SAG31_NODE_38_length_31498_cov_41.930539_13_plen_1433_part_00
MPGADAEFNSFYRALSPAEPPTNGRRSPERMHTTGALRRSREPLAPLHGPSGSSGSAGVEDWLNEQNAATTRSAVAKKAAAILAGDADWEPQLGDGRRSSGKSAPTAGAKPRAAPRPDSPKFDMPGFDGIMEKARSGTEHRPRAEASTKRGGVPPSPAVSSVRAPSSAAASQHSSGLGSYPRYPPEDTLGGAPSAQHGAGMNQTRGSTAFTDLGSLAEEEAQQQQPAFPGVRKERSEPALRGGRASHLQHGTVHQNGPGSAQGSPGTRQSPLRTQQQEPGRIRPRRTGSSTAATPAAHTTGAPGLGSAAGGPVLTRGFVDLDPGAMLAQLLTTHGGIDATDENGWTPLHWAAAQRKPDHVAALLDSGANSHLQSTAGVGPDHLGGGERPMGTTAMQLARFPADGGKPDNRVVKLLAAGERGGWRQRREFKELADAAMASQDYAAAVEFYEKALGAVLQVQDTAAMQLTAALGSAEDAVQREEEEQARQYEQQRAKAEAEQRALAAREAEAREQERQALEVLRNAEDLLEDGDVTSAIRVVEERADQLLRPSAPEAAERARIFLWNAIGRLQSEQQAEQDRAAARAEQVVDLQSKLTSVQTELAASEGAATAQQEVVASFNAQINKITQERDDAVADATRLNSDMESLRGDCVGTLQSAEEREAKLTAEQQRLDNELHEARAAVDAAKAETERTDREAADKIATMEREKMALKARTDELQAELEAGSKFASELEQKLAQTVQQSEKAMASANDWQGKYNEASAQITDLQDQLRKGSAAVEEKARQTTAAAAEWESARAREKEDWDAQMTAAAEAHSQVLATKDAELEAKTKSFEDQLTEKDRVAEEIRSSGEAALATEREVAAGLRQTVEAEKAGRAAAVETLRQESTKILADQADSARAAQEELALKLQAARAGHDETRQELADLQAQLQTNREEAAALSRRLSATEDERELERRALREETEKAEAAAVLSAEKSAAEQKALTDQANWRETLRKKVEDRCVKLEGTVAELSDQNAKLVQRLAETSTALASARDADEAKSNEVQRLERALEAAASAQQTLREEASQRQLQHAASLEAANAQLNAAETATAASAEAASAIQAKLAAEWACSAEAKGSVEEAQAETRRLTDTVAQRDLTIAQLRTAADKAIKQRELLISGHNSALQRSAAEHAERLESCIAERDKVAARLDEARRELLTAEQATLTESAEAERLAVELQNSRLREEQLIASLEERSTGLRSCQADAVEAANKAAAELATAAEERNAVEKRLEEQKKVLEDSRQHVSEADRRAAEAEEACAAAVVATKAAEEIAANTKAEKEAISAELVELGQRWSADLEAATTDRQQLLEIITSKRDLFAETSAGPPAFELAAQSSKGKPTVSKVPAGGRATTKANAPTMGANRRRSSVISSSSEEDFKPPKGKQGRMRDNRRGR